MQVPEESSGEWGALATVGPSGPPSEAVVQLHRPHGA